MKIMNKAALRAELSDAIDQLNENDLYCVELKILAPEDIITSEVIPPVNKIGRWIGQMLRHKERRIAL